MGEYLELHHAAFELPVQPLDAILDVPLLKEGPQSSPITPVFHFSIDA
jgi:hypothetical protein